MSDLYEWISAFWNDYPQEIIFILTLPVAFSVLKKKLNGKSRESYFKTKKGENFLIKSAIDNWFSKYRPLPLFILAVICGLFAFQQSKFELALELLFIATTLSIPAFKEEYSFTIFISSNKINLDGKKFKAENIAEIELWDDSINIKSVDGKTKTVDLDYLPESFEVMEKAINALKNFGEQHSIKVIDRFEHREINNEYLY